ncbi:FecR family protein, partial [Odoribacter splanchnicus]|nr:FecR family protein [Odoribacter splanchnicus]
ETVATTLVEGSVEVACAGKSFQIVPGEQIVYDKNNRVMDVRMVDTESYDSWKHGYYKFLKTTLEQIMEPLSVWNGL